jgi:hypothetical protein
MAAASTNTVENLILDLLEFVSGRERTYEEVIAAWRTSCPRLPVWEDACDRRLIEIRSRNGCLLVQPTDSGIALLHRRRPPVADR